MSSFPSQEIFASYHQGKLPELPQRIIDALDLTDQGYKQVLGVEYISAFADPDFHQAVLDEMHARRGKIHGIIGPLVYIDYENNTAFAPPGAALWQ